MNWHKGPMLGFDTETTGVNVESDRIVTSSLVWVHPGRTPDITSYLADPGVEIPEAATAIHGITTEHAREYGRPPVEVLAATAADLTTALLQGVPVVGMNVPYDMTILDRECRRHGVPTVGERLHGNVRPFVDVRVLDKRADTYRKGGRTLTDLCRVYGVRLDGAHDSSADALAACRVAWRIAEMYPEIVGLDLDELHDEQIQWHADQVKSFAEYRARQGKPLDDVCTDWPVRPYPAEAVA